MLRLEFGLSFDDLYATAGLARVDAAFCAQLALADAPLAARLASARADPDALGRREESELLIALAPHVEDFLARLFGIGAEVTALQAAQHELAPLFACKRQVVQRKALNKYKAEDAAGFDGAALARELEARLGAPLSGLRGELAFAQQVGAWGRDEAAHAAEIDLALRYAAWAVHTPAGKARHQSGVLFKAPRKLDFMRLIPVAARDAARRRDVAAARRAPAPARRLCLDRSGYRSGRRPGPGALLHLVPRAADRFLRHGPARKKAARGRACAIQEVALRRDARRLPAGGEDLGVPQAARRRLGARRTGGDLRRQSAGCGDRPSHLQRLHEGVHLSETGSGRHPAIGDAGTEGRPGAALGIRDLLAAHALEPAATCAARCRGRRRASAC